MLIQAFTQSSLKFNNNILNTLSTLLKSTFFCLIFIVTCSAAFGQNSKNEIILYGGLNFNKLSLPEGDFESTTEIGYHFGGAFKRGKFFYWQIGARYNSAKYGVKIFMADIDTSYTIAIRDVDVPVTFGINFLSATNRLLALRAFLSAVPAYTLSVGENDYNIGKDDINSFMIYLQGGIGINISLIVIEAGYNYGFDNLLENDTASKPGQVFVTLGFRF